MAAVIEAVATGIARAPQPLDRARSSRLIVTAMRSHPPAANAELARTAGEFGGPVVGFDLAGPEAAWPAPPHALAFVAAREAGLALTAHAGEVAGPQRVREVLDFGVRRVAHGVTAIEDPALLELLRARDITLDLCPTSNVQAGIVALLAEHPVAALHRAGVSVTISTDDRTVTGITLTQELARSATPSTCRPTSWRRSRSTPSSALRATGRHRAAPRRGGRGLERLEPRHHQLRRELKQDAHRVGVGRNRLGDALAVEERHHAAVGHPGEDEDRGAAGAMRADHVRVRVVADHHALRRSHAGCLEDGPEHRRRRLADHLRRDAGRRRQGRDDRARAGQESRRGRIAGVGVGRDQPRAAGDGAMATESRA